MPGREKKLKGPPVKGREVKLGLGERNALQLGGLHKNAEAMFLVLTVSGPRLTKEQLEKATRVLQRRHRFFSTVVRRSKSNTFYVVEDPTVVIPVVERPLEDLKETQRKIFSEELDVDEVLQTAAKIYLFQSADSGSGGAEVQQIGLYMHHFFSDGTSLANVAHRLLEAALAPDSASIDVDAMEYSSWTADSDTCAMRAYRKRHFTISFYWHCMKMLIWSTKSFFSPFAPSWCELPMKTSILSLPLQKRAAETRNHLILHEFSAEETKKLLELCRANGSTVTAIVCAAIEEAFVRQRKSKKVSSRIVGSSTASTRKACGATDEDLSHFVGGSFAIRLPKWSKKGDLNAESLWKRSLEVRKEINLSDDEKLAASWVASFGLGAMPNTTFRPTYGLSSWSAKGPIQHQYGDWQVTNGEFNQNCRLIYYPLFSMYTIVDKLHINLMALVPLFDPADLQRLFDMMVDILNNTVMQSTVKSTS